VPRPAQAAASVLALCRLGSATLSPTAGAPLYIEKQDPDCAQEQALAFQSSQATRDPESQAQMPAEGKYAHLLEGEGAGGLLTWSSFAQGSRTGAQQRGAASASAPTATPTIEPRGSPSAPPLSPFGWASSLSWGRGTGGGRPGGRVTSLWALPAAEG